MLSGRCSSKCRKPRKGIEIYLHRQSWEIADDCSSKCRKPRKGIEISLFRLRILRNTYSSKCRKPRKGIEMTPSSPRTGTERSSSKCRKPRKGIEIKIWVLLNRAMGRTLVANAENLVRGLKFFSEFSLILLFFFACSKCRKPRKGIEIIGLQHLYLEDRRHQVANAENLVRGLKFIKTSILDSCVRHGVANAENLVRGLKCNN